MKTNKMYIPAIFEPEYFYYDKGVDENYDEDYSESDTIDIDYCDNIETSIDEIANQVSKKGIDVDKIKGNLFIENGSLSLYIGKTPIEVGLNMDSYAPLSRKKLITAIKSSPHYKPNIQLQDSINRRKKLREELKKINKILKKFGIYD